MSLKLLKKCGRCLMLELQDLGQLLGSGAAEQIPVPGLCHVLT